MPNAFQFSLAPQDLWQAINPVSISQRGGQFGLINIDLGQTPAPLTERTILEEVGSYGRQLGRIGDALEVLVRHFGRQGLGEAENDALDIVLGQLAEIRQIKKATGREDRQQRRSS